MQDHKTRIITHFAKQQQMHLNCVTNFHDLVSTPFLAEVNAICWARTLNGDFSEIVESLKLNGNIKEIEEEELRELQLSDQGALAREFLLNDLKLLKDYGASPLLNLIKYYDTDDELQIGRAHV